MAHGVEFDWDVANVAYLKRHRVTPLEFEEVLTGDPVHLDYQDAAGEDRYKVLGADQVWQDVDRGVDAPRPPGSRNHGI